LLLSHSRLWTLTTSLDISQSICRRGEKLLSFLLEKVDLNRFRQDDLAPLEKRTRLSTSASLSAHQPRPSRLDDLRNSESETKHKHPIDRSSEAFSSSSPYDSPRPLPQVSLPPPISRQSFSYSSSSPPSSLDVFSSSTSSNPSLPPHSHPTPQQPSLDALSASDQVARLDFASLLGLDGKTASFDFSLSPRSHPLPAPTFSYGAIGERPSPRGGETADWMAPYSLDPSAPPPPLPPFSFSPSHLVGTEAPLGGGTEGQAKKWEGWWDVV
jgi:hypothetical protein